MAPWLRAVGGEASWSIGPGFADCVAVALVNHGVDTDAIAANLAAATAPLQALQAAASEAIAEGAASGFAAAASGEQNSLTAAVAGGIGGMVGGLAAAAAFNNANASAIADAVAAADAAEAQAQSDRCDALREACEALVACAEEYCPEGLETMTTQCEEKVAAAGCE